LNVNAVGAQANIRTANIANVHAANVVASEVVVTTANATTANVTTANIGSVTVSTLANVASLNVTTANVATLNVNASGATANIANANIANLATANVIATAARATSFNATTGNISTLFVTTLTVTDPISAPAEVASESYRLRVGLSPRGVGTFGVFQGTSNGNAAIRFNTTGNVWQTTANDIEGTFSTVVTTANIGSAYSSDAANVASLTLVKGANDNALAAYASSNVAANTVRVSAQSASTIHNAQLNFINSASINVAVVTGVTGNANISFTANSSNPALLGPQGVQGTTGIQGSTGPQGIQGVQGTKGTDGIIGSNGSQGTTGAQGTQGTTGATGNTGGTGSQGTTGATGGAGSTGAQGTTGANGADGAQGTTGATGGTGGTGAQGTTGGTGSQGTTGAQGVQGTTGIQGRQGTTGSTGATGPSTAINATNSSGGNFYLVGVTSTGANYTPYAYLSGAYQSGGSVYAIDFSASSDLRLKNVHEYIHNAVDIVERLNAIKYTWNDLALSKGYVQKGTQVGVIAQEVMEVLPEAVTVGEEGYMSVSYDRLVPVLIEAIKELNARIKVLEGK
jgi:hypothetical protein